MATESTLGVQDIVTAQMVECAPVAPAVVALPESSPEQSPAQRIAEATLAQTGADPPPVR